jgi:hypothetical protein
MTEELQRARANVRLWRQRVEQGRAGIRLWPDDKLWLAQWQIEVKRLTALAASESG